MDIQTDALMLLIRAAVTETMPDPARFAGLTEEQWQGVFRLADRHDLAHLAGDTALRMKVVPEGTAKRQFETATAQAIRRFGRLEYELSAIKRLFGACNIPFIPLKGAVLRRYYPQPWLRPSCDIDILVPAERLDEAKEALERQLHYTFEHRAYHDMLFRSPSRLALELHFHIGENDPTLDAVLERAWEFAAPEVGSEYRFSDAFFFFHQIAHAAYHFKSGGCGIRPILDVFLLQKRLDCDRAALGELLREAHLERFYEEMRRLAAIWFSDRPHDAVTRQMESYILRGGVYGSFNNRVKTQQALRGGKLGWWLGRIFVPYKALCGLYPSLEGKKWLLPLYEVRRWCGFLRPKKFRRGLNEIRTDCAIGTDEVKQTRALLEALGLQ